MLNDKFTTLYYELAESSGLKFVRAEVARPCAEHGAPCTRACIAALSELCRAALLAPDHSPWLVSSRRSVIRSPL